VSDFAPGIAAAKLALGNAVKIETQAHPKGASGVKFSLEQVAEKSRDGRNDPRVRAWAIRAIHDAGGPQDQKDQAVAILTALKKATTYVQDPVNTEFMQAVTQTLCLDDKGLCFKGGDCFAKGTLIRHQTKGDICIDKLIVGDVIWGLNDWTRVEAVVDKSVLPVCRIALCRRAVDFSAYGTGSNLFLTEGHWVYVVSENGGHSRVQVKDLKRQQRLLMPEKLRSKGFESCWIADVDCSLKQLPCIDIQTSDHYVYLPEHDITVSNCDDLVIAYASATMSVGILTQIVGQSFDKSGVPSHVIAAVGLPRMDPWTKKPIIEWKRVDPSTNKAVGDYVVATKERWLDPLDPEDKGTSGISGTGDFVGIGMVPSGVRQGSTGLARATDLPVARGSVVGAWVGVVGIVAVTLGGPLLWSLSNSSKKGR
jgi:hypothetical protein